MLLYLHPLIIFILHKIIYIFANDEQTILRRLSFIFALFDLFEKYANQILSIRIYITNFLALRHRIFNVEPIVYVNLIL